MRNLGFIIFILVSILVGVLLFNCDRNNGNLRIILAFQYSEVGGLTNFIDKYANRLIVSIYGNNMTPVKKSLSFPDTPEWICLHDGGFYKPDSEGFVQFDIYHPPYCEYGDRQFSKVVVSLNVPEGVGRSILVETLDKNDNVTFRGYINDLNIEEDTSVQIKLNPIARIGFSVFEITDIKGSKYEAANSGKLKAYYFERGSVINNERKNYATLIGERTVSKDKKAVLDFEYSGIYYEFDEQSHRHYLLPSLFGYYNAENGAISFIMPGLAESLGYGLEPGKSYEMTIYSALRERIKTNPILSAVVPGEANYTYYEDAQYGRWDWLYAYVSYIHSFNESLVKVIRVYEKVDISEDVVIYSTNPVGSELHFPNEVYDVGRLKNIEEEFYMGFRNIPLPNFSETLPSKVDGYIIIWMEFETADGNRYKTNEVTVKYRVSKLNSESLDGGH